MKIERSEQEFTRAKALFPGGVNSPVRAFRSVGGTPRFIQRANGAYLWDVDGNRYIDYVGAWGPAILGHAHPEVVEAVARTAKDGLCFGAPSVGESDLADAIRAAVPSIEKMRLVSSGTEACMAAIRLARAFTGRNKIVKFTGCYHGHADMLLAKAGSGVATFGLPDSAGVPPETTQHTLTVRYNDIQGLQDIFAAHPSQLAGVILEPIIGNSGFIRPTIKFIQTVESLCRASGTLLIYDEVHLLPAQVFRFTASLQAIRRLGLTATLVREDGREEDVFSLIGPKCFDVPWKVIEKSSKKYYQKLP